MRNASVPLLLQNGFGRFYYASAYDFRNISVKLNKSLAYGEPLIFPLLSTESVDMISSGSEYTRVEKTLRIADLNLTYANIDVCTNMGEAGNCSVCEKCMRTLLTLDIAGLINRYEHAFDLQKYYQERENYIGKILFKKDSFSLEIIQYAKKQSYHLPLRTILLPSVIRYAKKEKYSHPRLRCYKIFLFDNLDLIYRKIRGFYRHIKSLLIKN